MNSCPASLNRDIVFFTFLLFSLSFSIKISAESFITKKTKDNILSLQEIQFIGAILVSKENEIASSTVVFKKDNCPAYFNEVDGDVFFLQTINKLTGLPANYVPNKLVNIKPYVKTSGNIDICMTEIAAKNLHRMSEAMNREGLFLIAVSGYRSQFDQKILYNKYASTMNKGVYHRVAPPGHSEHQLGTAIDVASEFKSGQGFAFSAESLWLKNNAANYGFLISYEEGHEHKTGYIYEPWHIRYVGIENAILLNKADYSLAYKPAYYKTTFMNNFLGLLKNYVSTQDVKI